MLEVIKQFGVAALFGTLIIVGSFTIIGIGVAQDKVSFDVLLPMIGAWVGSVTTAYFAIKGMMTSKEK